MTDPQVRPQRATTQDGDAKVLVYDFHIEIEVKGAAIDEKRVKQLIEERIGRLATTLKNCTP